MPIVLKFKDEDGKEHETNDRDFLRRLKRNGKGEPKKWEQAQKNNLGKG